MVWVSDTASRNSCEYASQLHAGAEGVRDGHYWTIHAAHSVTALLVVLAGWMSKRVWERVGRGVPGEDGHGTDRDRFLAMMGMLSAGFFLLLLIAHWVPNFLLGACR